MKCLNCGTRLNKKNLGHIVIGGECFCKECYDVAFTKRLKGEDYE